MMSRFFPGHVAWAYFKSAHTRSRSLRLIARGAMVGLALSLMILIITLSVMNGFERDIRNKLLTKNPHITAFHTHDLVIPETYEKEILKSEKAYQLRLLLPQWQFHQAQVRITTLVEARQISTGLIASKNIPAQIDCLGLKVPSSEFVRFTLNNVSSFEDPSPVLLLPMSDLPLMQDLGIMKTQGFWLHDPFAVDAIAQTLKEKYPSIKIISWKDQHQSFFDALTGEKRLISFVLGLLIVLIYVQFALTLVLIFNDKKNDLIVLSSCCQNKNVVYETFFLYGAINVIFGVALGLFAGSLGAYYLPTVTAFLESTFHFQFLPYQHYSSQTLPSEVQMADLIYTTFFALTLGLCTAHTLARYGQNRSKKYRLAIGD